MDRRPVNRSLMLAATLTLALTTGAYGQNSRAVDAQITKMQQQSATFDTRSDRIADSTDAAIVRIAERNPSAAVKAANRARAQLNALAVKVRANIERSRAAAARRISADNTEALNNLNATASRISAAVDAELAAALAQIRDCLLENGIYSQ